LGEKWDARLSFDAAYALTKETRGETLGKGLYDHMDLGGRGSVAWNLEQFGHKASASLALRGYSRKYPNFRSLASENLTLPASVSGTERHPKDFVGIEPALAGVWWWTPSVQTRAGYAASSRSYSDRYLRTTQGAISPTKRADRLHRLETETTVMGLGDVTVGAELSGMVNLSNASVYDANQPVHAYIPHFYQFTSVSVGPWGMWVIPVERELKPRVRLGASLMMRQFTDRLVQDASGMYQDEMQRDTEWGADLRGWDPIRSWIGATAGIGGKLVRSNNRFQRFIRYNYEVLNLSAGVTFSY
jgi:hypothetical protein